LNQHKKSGGRKEIPLKRRKYYIDKIIPLSDEIASNPFSL
jgi:hypothetical protein